MVSILAGIDHLRLFGIVNWVANGQTASRLSLAIRFVPGDFTDQHL